MDDVPCPLEGFYVVLGKHECKSNYPFPPRRCKQCGVTTCFSHYFSSHHDGDAYCIKCIIEDDTNTFCSQTKKYNGVSLQQRLRELNTIKTKRAK